MDGLECVEIDFSSIKEKTYDFRIESEYYKKEYIELQSILTINSINELDDGLVDFVSDGTHFTPSYVEKGIPFISAINVKENYFDSDVGYKCIDKNTHCELCKRVHPKPRDILLRKVGVGPRLCCVVPKGAFDFSVFVSVAVIRPRINPYYLSTFINSSYGQKQLLRFNKGISQPDLHLEDIRKLNVPLFSDVFYNSIENIVYNSELKSNYSKQLIRECEEYISDYLCIETIKNNNLNYTIKSVKESFLSSGRMDAEYYQPKYDSLFKTLQAFKCEPLGGENGLCNFKKSIEPGSDAYRDSGIPFVRVSDIDKYGIAQPQIHLSSDIVENVNELFPKEDTILLSKDGSVGVAYKVREDMDFITSGALLHLTVKDKDIILPDYLTLVLNSPIVQLQAERDTNGAIIQHWKPSEIEKVLIPILKMDIQKEIALKVQESFALRKESKDLLEYAKQAVEIAIEQGENKALEWLRSKEI